MAVTPRTIVGVNDGSKLFPENTTSINSNNNSSRERKASSSDVRPDEVTPNELLNLTPNVGEIVFDTTNQLLKFWNGNVWENAGASAVVVGQRASNYATLQDGTVVGELGYCNLPQGTQWLPGTVGGNYYPAGWYLWDGSTWTSDRNNIVNQLQLNVNGLGTKSNVGHTHVKADITDFNDGDYATQNQGGLADTAIQPNDNISELNNNAGFITSSALGIEGLSGYFNELTYSNGDLTKIETWADITKQVKLFTKQFTYSSGRLTQISLTNETTSSVTNKTLSYDAQDNLISITK
tara:strand:+ start:1397 stop:2278 length:882 start_codon:yes stop_codon:yes gene_type:complete